MLDNILLTGEGYMSASKGDNNVIRLPTNKTGRGSGNSGVPVPAVAPKPESY
jgi:hypothetical protein